MNEQVKKKNEYDYHFINHIAEKKLVQVGACDGVMADKVRDYIMSSNIESLLIEPVSYNYNRLVQNYRNAPCVNLLQCAIDDHEGTREITYFENVPGADHMIGVASFYDTQWKSMYPNAWKTETVPCRTLASVLTQFGMEDANIYQIDTEGHDYHIIKQIDFFMHLEKDFFLVSEHFWDSSTAEFDIQKNKLLEQLTNIGFYIETIYGRRSGNKTGIQISRLCE